MLQRIKACFLRLSQEYSCLSSDTKVKLYIVAAFRIQGASALMSNHGTGANGSPEGSDATRAEAVVLLEESQRSLFLY